MPASEDLTFLLRNTYKRRLFLLKKVIPTARKLALEQQKAEEGEGAEDKRLCWPLSTLLLFVQVVLMRYNLLYCLCRHLAGGKKIIFIRLSWRRRMKLNFLCTKCAAYIKIAC